MHLIHQVVPCFCWGDPKDKPVFHTNTSRKRLNILGAYNIDEHRLIHLTGENNCDSELVINFFELMLINCKHLEKIYLILDNAKYFKSRLVREWLNNNPKIELIFLPPFAPNLNIIERFWRLAKEILVKNNYYKHYKTFRANVFRFLNNINPYKSKLESLMTDNFQIVSN